jgi:site-specific DNA-methyltransferase (adenine-specific)
VIKEVIGNATLYLGDCLEILPTLADVDAIITDPPYGMRWDAKVKKGKLSTGGSYSKHYGRAIAGDDSPFDPTPWLHFQKVVMWGSNHYWTNLPKGTTLVWIKRMDSGFGSFLSDAELAWMKGGHGVYCFRDLSGQGDARMGLKEHPMQKPVRLMKWCIKKSGATGMVLDPYMGSGSTGVACASSNLPFIGVEIDPQFFKIACERVENAQRQERLFA